MCSVLNCICIYLFTVDNLAPSIQEDRSDSSYQKSYVYNGTIRIVIGT